jgi:hypothetical protein
MRVLEAVVPAFVVLDRVAGLCRCSAAFRRGQAGSVQGRRLCALWARPGEARVTDPDTPSIDIGGPGFCFPVQRWNGREYRLHGYQHEGKVCKPS